MRFGGNAGMQRESADLAGTAFQQTGVAGQYLQGADFAPGLRAGGDAVGDRTHPQRVHAIAAARAVRQETGFVLVRLIAKTPTLPLTPSPRILVRA